MYTTLYVINLISGEQNQITFPKKNELDISPQVVGTNITWYRMNDKKNQGDVWVKDWRSGQEYRWLKNVDSAPTFFSKSN
ncbi:hypothetical protein [Viridibacillus arvi]